MSILGEQQLDLGDGFIAIHQERYVHRDERPSTALGVYASEMCSQPARNHKGLRELAQIAFANLCETPEGPSINDHITYVAIRSRSDGERIILDCLNKAEKYLIDLAASPMASAADRRAFHKSLSHLYKISRRTAVVPLLVQSHDLWARKSIQDQNDWDPFNAVDCLAKEIAIGRDGVAEDNIIRTIYVEYKKYVQSAYNVGPECFPYSAFHFTRRIQAAAKQRNGQASTPEIKQQQFDFSAPVEAENADVDNG